MRESSNSGKWTLFKIITQKDENEYKNGNSKK